MAWQGPQVNVSLKAAGDLTAKQYHFVKLDTDGNVVITAAATDKPIGVVQNKPNTNQTANVCVIGITKVSADAALDESDLIGTSTDGQADKKLPGTDTTEYIVGQMLTATSTASELGTAAINCASPTRAA